MCVADLKAQRKLLQRYWWIFSPLWLTPSDTSYVVAMSTPEVPKGTSERKRRSRSTETGREEKTSSPPHDSPPETQPESNVDQGPPEETNPEPVVETPTPTSAKKRRKKGKEEEGSQAGGEAESDMKEKKKKAKDQADKAGKGRDNKVENKKKTKAQLKRNVRALEGAEGAASSKSQREVVREDQIGPLHHPNPGDPEAGTGADDQRRGDPETLEDVPLLAISPLPTGKRWPGGAKCAEGREKCRRPRLGRRLPGSRPG